MADPPKRLYWDSCAWIGLVNAEPNKIHALRDVWEDAQKGKFEIWTSAYTHLEVFKVRSDSGDPLPLGTTDDIIDSLLEQPFVKRVQVDVPIAKLARDLRRALDAHGFKSRRDAIHLATAAYWNIDELHTWDRADLLEFNGRVNRNDGQPLVIRIPGAEVMGPLFAAPRRALRNDTPEG